MAFPVSTHSCPTPVLEVVVLGVGAGASTTYSGECSSSFMICQDGLPVLMLDVGLGSVAAALRLVGSLPPHIYVSHNHTDHAGELPVLLAVEAAAGRRKCVVAEEGVMQTLQLHRLAELRSTGHTLSHFADFQSVVGRQTHHLPPHTGGGGGEAVGGSTNNNIINSSSTNGSGSTSSHLALRPVKSRHSERCWGLLLTWQGQPVLGWTADSGYDEELYGQLAAAPLLLLDGRAVGSAEHAGFAELQAAVDAGVFGTAQLCVYGYGTVSQAPHSDTYPGLRVLKPGDRLPLKVMDPANNSNQPHALTASQPCQSAAAELQPV